MALPRSWSISIRNWCAALARLSQLSSAKFLIDSQNLTCRPHIVKLVRDEALSLRSHLSEVTRILQHSEHGGPKCLSIVWRYNQSSFICADQLGIAVDIGCYYRHTQCHTFHN